MFSIFNGRQRTLGEEERRSIFLQVDVTMRQHLHLFKGARLGSFMAIGLHSNEHGWAHPTNNTLQDETGYIRPTISEAIKDLCNLTINGHRVLLAVSTKKPSGAFGGNWYLLFPSAAEVEFWAPYSPHLENPLAALITDPKQPTPTPCTEKPRTAEPCMGKPRTAEPRTVNPHDMKKNHTSKPEPTIQGEPSIQPAADHYEDLGTEKKGKDGWMDEQARIWKEIRTTEQGEFFYKIGCEVASAVRDLIHLPLSDIQEAWERAKVSNARDPRSILILNLRTRAKLAAEQPPAEEPPPYDPTTDPRRPDWVPLHAWSEMTDTIRTNLIGAQLIDGEIVGTHPAITAEFKTPFCRSFFDFLYKQEATV